MKIVEILAAALDPHNGQPDGDAYFDMERDVAETHNDRCRATLAYMIPADFLRMAKPGQDAGKQATVRDLLDRGVKFRSLPVLSVGIKRMDSRCRRPQRWATSERNRRRKTSNEQT